MCKLDGGDKFAEVLSNFPQNPCYDCPYFEEWEEDHPYGDGTAKETLNECNNSQPDNCIIITG